MSTKTLLAKCGIKTAIIVDDAYDIIPRAEDLDAAGSEWSNFFADYSKDDEKAISEFFPGIKEAESQVLQADDDFIAALWNNRALLRPDLINPLFEEYDGSSARDREFLKYAYDSLKALGLEVTESGRDFVEKASTKDFILIDLYLGTPQTASDMERSMKGLKMVIDGRQDNPPPIILMSRSPGLSSKADTFRDYADLFASSFRLIKKLEIRQPGRLEQIIFSLTGQREDSLKLTSFLHNWRKGITSAVDATAADIRRLDLADWAQINDLLLSYEGTTTGSYILDVFDRVLLHEVERQENIIKAAKELNTLNSDDYPPMTIAGSNDTLALLHKTLFQHQNRRALDASEEAYPVAFGDILGMPEGVNVPESSFFAGEPSDQVYIVMTRACDLLRKKAVRALLMAGTCKPLDAKSVDLVKAGPRTAVLLKDGSNRFLVDWHFENVLALTSDQLNDVLSSGGMKVLDRLRESAALPLQQAMLSSLGKIGEMATLPSTFPAKVSVLFPNFEGELTPLLVNKKAEFDAVCWAGRDGDNSIARLPFSAEVMFPFIDAVEALAAEDVHPRSLDKIKKCTMPETIEFLFSKGVKLNVSSSLSDWKAPTSDGEIVLGKIACNELAKDVISSDQHKQKAGLIFQVEVTLH